MSSNNSNNNKKYQSVVKSEFEGFDNDKQMERKTGDVLEHTCIGSGRTFSSVSQCCSRRSVQVCTQRDSRGRCQGGSRSVCA
jgi:hypothetical protein